MKLASINAPALVPCWCSHDVQNKALTTCVTMTQTMDAYLLNSCT